MPFSAKEGKDQLLDFLRSYDINTMLDIGPGDGVYSDLVRQRWPKAKITGIEAWGPYVNDFNLTEKYDEIIIADVRYVDPTVMVGHDLVTIGDVIEHLTKQDARVILDWLCRYNGLVWISFPVLHLDQEPYEGNWFEVHKEHWTYEEFEKFIEDSGFHIVFEGKGEILAWFLIVNN